MDSGVEKGQTGAQRGPAGFHNVRDIDAQRFDKITQTFIHGTVVHSRCVIKEQAVVPMFTCEIVVQNIGDMADTGAKLRCIENVDDGPGRVRDRYLNAVTPDNPCTEQHFFRSVSKTEGGSLNRDSALSDRLGGYNRNVSEDLFRQSPVLACTPTGDIAGCEGSDGNGPCVLTPVGRLNSPEWHCGIKPSSYTDEPAFCSEVGDEPPRANPVHTKYAPRLLNAKGTGRVPMKHFEALASLGFEALAGRTIGYR